MLFLSGRDLEEVLRANEAVEAVAEAFRQYSSGEITQPPRQVLNVIGRWWGVMTSYSRDYFVLKLVNVIEENRLVGLPSVQGVVLLLSSKDGSPLAIMDGTTLTAIRTAAASVLSTELASGRNVDVLGVIGAGIQARYHIKLATSYLKVGRVLIAARTNHMKLAREVGGEASELTKLLTKSSVIFSTTSSNSPVVLGKYLGADFHVVSVGAHTPDSRELDDEVIRRARTFMVDSIEAASKETGDVIEPMKAGLLRELVEIGKALREGKVERPSIFKTVGIAAEDNLSAVRAYENALRRGIGKVLM